MRRILVVDDEPSIREVLCTFFQDQGFEAESASDGRMALDQIPVFRPDVVFLDVAMPGINGLKTLERIREIDAGCCVIMMSGHANHHAALKALDQGARDFIQKPFDFKYLRTMLVTLMATLAPAAGRSGQGGAPE